MDQSWIVLSQQLLGTAAQPGQLAALTAHFGDAPGDPFTGSGMENRPIEAVMMLARVPQFAVS